MFTAIRFCMAPMLIIAVALNSAVAQPNRPANYSSSSQPADWKSAMREAELARLPKATDESKAALMKGLNSARARMAVSPADAISAAANLRSLLSSNKAREAELSSLIDKMLGDVRATKDATFTPISKAASDRSRFVRLVAEREARKELGREGAILLAKAEELGGKSPAVRSTTPLSPTVIAREGGPCQTVEAQPLASTPKFDFLGVSIGMTEAQAVRAACQASGNDVKILSTSPGRTYQSAKSYYPNKEFKKSDYVNASNAMGKPYKGGIRLCIGCSNKTVSSRNDLLRQPGEVEISFLPNGKIFRINRSYLRSLEWSKPTYSTVLSSMQRSFGSPSFKLQTEGYAEIGWHYYEGGKSGRLESWFWDKKPNSTSLLQLRDTGVLFPKGYYSEQELRRENPKNTYCLSQHFADGGTTGWGRYFLFEGPRMDVMYKVEHKSFEQVQREAATWVAPGYTKNCGPLIFATVGFPDAEMWKNNERTSTKDYGRDIPTGGLSMTMIDVPALDEWKNSERREIEAYIRSRK